MVTSVGYYREAKLTGKKRVRRGWFGKLILQVEVELEYMAPLDEFNRYGNGPYVPPNPTPDRKVRWRDAKANDMGLETAEITLT